MKTQAPMPDKIGRYQILERVGRGGMGVLYRGHDPVLDREVAVKVMLADFTEDTEQMRPRFYREARSAARLQHRNIVTIFEFAEENNQPHIVMEFLRGSPLSSRMEELPPLTLDDKLDIVTQLCSGLGYAHKEGIVHRDVKPANVFILQDGTVKLLDFGIAKLATSTLTRQGDVVGSAPYMSPEQIAGAQDLDGRSDVWSTGVLLYELLTGRKPFDGEGLTTVIAGILREQPAPLDKYVPGLPKQLLDCVSRALEKDREKRYQTAEELGRELQLIRKTQQLSAPPPMDETRLASTNVLKALHEDRLKQNGDLTLAPPPAAREPAAAASGSKTWVIAAAVAIAVMGVAGGGYFISQQGAPPPAETAAPATTLAQPTAPPASAASSAATPPSTASVEKSAAPARKTAPVDKPAAPPVKKNVAAVSSGSPAPPASPASLASPASPARGNVAVTISGGYEFEVWDGSRKISALARSHELSAQANGRTLRLVAPEVLLDHAFKIDGSADNRFEYLAPGLGRIQLRAARENCNAFIGKKDLGPGPWPKAIPVAAGNHQVSLVCPDGQNPIEQTNVAPGLQRNVFFKGQ